MTTYQCYFLLSCFILLGFFVYYIITKKYGYWKRKNVPHLAPSFLFGNYKEFILLKKYSGHVAAEICEQFPDVPYVGTYLGTEPALLLRDPEMIKLVLTKDYSSFSGREISNYCDREVVTQCMFFDSGDSWKIARQNLTPLFSSAKMKNMFYLIENSSKTFEKYLAEEVTMSSVIDVKQLISLFTMDCICSCILGINTEIMDKTNTDSPFPKLGKSIFTASKWVCFKGIFRSIWPLLFYKCGLQYFNRMLQPFFHHVLIDVMNSRKNREPLRHDFVDLLLTWKNQEFLTGNSLTSDKSLTLKVTDDLLVSQCVQMFGAGYETSSFTLSCTLFELSKHKYIQSKVIEEVDAYFKKHDGKIEYECVNEMPYLEACINEAMRLYPVLGLNTRECMRDYTFPTGLRVEKGMRVHIPTFYLHHNAKYFPDPEVYRPERFLGAEKNNITPYTYLPFGEGPKICIGYRFAKMQMMAAMLTICKGYEVERAESMPTKLDLVPGAITTQVVGDIYLKFIPRSI